MDHTLDVEAVDFGIVFGIGDLKQGQQAKLYTYLNVREDAMELYGFYSESELSCFQMLLGVSGVGPKAALAMLSATTPEGLAASVITGDERAFDRRPGGWGRRSPSGSFWS